MKFYFPDSQDQIDPGFDFLTEERDPFRVRQRDDLYAHEVLTPAPFDGLLVSKSIVDGKAGRGAGKYTGAQRHRLYRDGAEAFFRLTHGIKPLTIMGDCGAFSYVEQTYPPYSVDEVLDFYEGCGFDYGISVDHVIFQFEPAVSRTDTVAAEWVRRQQITMELAADFRRACRSREVNFEPIGVAQGWSPASYADAVEQLQHIGYARIALGGMVPLKSHEILACLRAVNEVRSSTTQFHLLGISRCDDVPEFASYGVSSFDTTSPFRQAFKDDRNNYHASNGNYVAIRVPQVDGNVKLKARIQSGEISQEEAVKLERLALDFLRKYDRDEVSLSDALSAVRDYSRLWNSGKADRADQYRKTLEDRPWKSCNCDLCLETGIDIVLFRGSERNKRRGFHNLYVFRRQLDDRLEKERA